MKHEQLIGRSAIEIDLGAVREQIEGHSIFVTGAAGSIGSLLTEELLNLGPAKLLLLDRSEQDLQNLALRLSARPDCRVEFVLGDFLNTALLTELLDAHRPSIAFHAAAYKHVGLVESQPLAVLENNAVGTHILFRQLCASSVRRLILISSDKAVEPQGVMGASKRLAELLVLGTVHDRLSASAVRLANVLGSRGSVLPRFEQQIRRGEPLTVSNPDVTRHFLLPHEAVGMTLQSLVAGKGRDILVPELGAPVRILDLAKRLLNGGDPAMGVRFTGLVSGEKLHENLITAEERVSDTEYPALRRIFAPLPEPMEVNAWARRLANCVQQRDLVGAIDIVRETLPSYSPSDTVLSLCAPGAKKAQL